MRPRTAYFKGFLSICTLLLASTLAMADTSNKWRLEFSGNAESEGEILIRVFPKLGDPIDINVIIPMNSSENEVAERVETLLDAALPEDKFHVERDDGEDVLIKKRMGEENFRVLIVSNTVKDLRINLNRE